MGFLYSQLFVTPKYPTESFEDRVVIVTGANVGLGFEAARHFARLNAAKVILAVRNVAAGAQAQKSIEQSTKRAGVCEVWELDLASYASVRAFAQRAAAQLDRIDVLMENAGIATSKFSRAEGHERTITVNVIGTFLLGLLLLPKLKETAAKFPSAPPPHWTIVSSEVHAWTDLPEHRSANTFVALDDEKSARMSARYPASKLIEVLAVRELATATAMKDNYPVILNMLNPGLCHSQLSRDGPWIFAVFKFFLARSTEVGSRTLVAAAAAGANSHGAYMTDGKVANGALSSWVRSADGERAQKKVWKELCQILEDIEPGVTTSL